ncbi:hypothetical protein FHS22_002239 [Planomonospora venezuelensis]|uniref:Uncharacterized protein n=1 Tax=Planomonospora venezuelensis TaxID=1999 RepID=A0A841CYC2_PLAVE|nr:hypothetical protein [Planomonospora venezuelensis]
MFFLQGEALRPLFSNPDISGVSARLDTDRMLE